MCQVAGGSQPFLWLTQAWEGGHWPGGAKEGWTEKEGPRWQPWGGRTWPWHLHASLWPLPLAGTVG